MIAPGALERLDLFPRETRRAACHWLLGPLRGDPETAGIALTGGLRPLRTITTALMRIAYSPDEVRHRILVLDITQLT